MGSHLFKALVAPSLFPSVPKQLSVGHSRGKRWGDDLQVTVLKHLQVYWEEFLSERISVVLQPKRCQPVHVP